MGRGRHAPGGPRLRPADIGWTKRNTIQTTAPSARRATSWLSTITDAAPCDSMRNKGDGDPQSEAHNSLRIAKLCEPVQEHASGHGGSRTHTRVTPQGILSPQ